jgi:cobalamin biosynthesis Mg chelatase CobN
LKRWYTIKKTKGVEVIKQASTRTNQGGSILIFTVVAVLLALALVGAVLFVRNKGEVAQTQMPIMGPVTPPGEAPSESTEGDKREEGTNTTPQNSPATDSEASNNAPSSTSELPKTGPADVVGGTLVVALVAMTLTGYIRSRHLSWQL